jgi:PAS domain S-box-containing protein/putative nucleotidyltransferase with HDIG domain
VSRTQKRDQAGSLTAEDTLRASSQSAHLADAAMALLRCRSEADVYEVACDLLVVLDPGAAIVVNEIGPDPNVFVTRMVGGVDRALLSKVTELAGFEIIGKSWAVTDSLRDQLLDGTLTKVGGGFSELTASDIPGPIAKVIATTFGVHDVYAAGIADRESALGCFIVIARTNNLVPPAPIIESFARHCFSALESIRAARELAESAETNDLILHHMTEGLAFHEMVFGEDGKPRDYRFLDVNPAFETMTGLSAEDVIGHTALEVTPNLDPGWIERYGEVATTGVPIRFEDYVSDLDRHLGVAAYSPRPGHFVSVITDITERARTQRELKAAEERSHEKSELVSLLLDSTAEAVHGSDAEGRITFCNAAFLRITGFEEKDVLGHNGHELIHHTRAEGTPYPAADCRLFASAMSGESVHVERETLWRADGTSFPAELWMHPLSRDGVATGAVVTFLDITERVRLEEAMQRRLVALTQPPAATAGLTFSDLFDIDEIQSIQDAFSAATGVASIITTPDGTPITRPSNYSRLCMEVIQGTERGLANCRASDAAIGCAGSSSPVVRHCLSAGLWDAGASIHAGPEHVANWLVAQVRDEQQSDEELVRYADEIGADPEDFASALAEIPTIIAQALFSFATELSVVAYQNVQQARFITERQMAEVEMVSLNIALERREEERVTLLDRVADMLTSVIDIVGSVSETRDPYTAGHQRRVARLATDIAREMGLPDADIEDIRVAALMHDIGNMSIPAEILSKPGKLSSIEFSLIQGHPEVGYRIISSAKMQGPIAEIVHQHHERCDGSGYPRGLDRKDLLPGARILMVADVVEAMMSHRPYRSALGQDAALDEIRQGAGRLYDPDVAAACDRVFAQRSFDFAEK